MNAFPDGLGHFFVHIQMGNILLRGGEYLKDKMRMATEEMYNKLIDKTDTSSQ